MSDLLQEIQGPVLSLKLNRPDRLNAFSESMLRGLQEGLAEAACNEAIGAVVLSGMGRAFSAGGDVKTMGRTTPEQVYQHVGVLNDTIRAMKRLEKPIIASVHGVAAGAGFNLALASDLIVAGESARFIMSFAQVGLISDGGGLALLTGLVGPQRAKELFFFAEPLEAARAYQLGIVNRVVPEEQLETVVGEWARRLAHGPRQAIAQTKRLVDRALNAHLQEMLEAEQITQSVLATSADHREGVRAFQEKRAPRFGQEGRED